MAAFALLVFSTTASSPVPAPSPLTDRELIPALVHVEIPGLNFADIPATSWDNEAVAAVTAIEGVFSDLPRALETPPNATEPVRIERKASEFGDNIEIFGSLGLRVSSDSLGARLARILEENASIHLSGDCADAKFCANPRIAAMRDAVTRLKHLPLTEQVHAANLAVNRAFLYASDREIFGVADHWATLREFAGKGAGDCEDFAIAKMWLLDALGVPRDSMRLVALRDLKGGPHHAVLVVRIGDRNLVLDNQTGQVREDISLTRYQPVYSLSVATTEGGVWVHAAPRPATQKVAQWGGREGQIPSQ